VDTQSQIKLAVEQIVGLSEQIITLSSAILVLSITFAKDVLKTPTQGDRALLRGAWLGYLLAIVAGVWLRMAVAGTLLAGTRIGEFNTWFPAAIQILTFLAATVLFLWLAIGGLKRGPDQPTAAPNNTLEPSAQDCKGRVANDEH
jgi:hypothetical protein